MADNECHGDHHNNDGGHHGYARPAHAYHGNGRHNNGPWDHVPVYCALVEHRLYARNCLYAYRHPGNDCKNPNGCI